MELEQRGLDLIFKLLLGGLAEVYNLLRHAGMSWGENCHDGLLIALELKKDEKGKADKLQEYVLHEIDKAGGIALVAHPNNFDEIKNYIVKQTSF